MLVSTVADRILERLTKVPAGLDDGQLAEALELRRQTVNQVCRRLSDNGRLHRAPGPNGRIVNRLLPQHDAYLRPPSARPDEQAPSPAQPGSQESNPVTVASGSDDRSDADPVAPPEPEPEPQQAAKAPRASRKKSAAPAASTASVATSGGQPAADQDVLEPPRAAQEAEAKPSSKVSAPAKPAKETVRTPPASSAGASGPAEETSAVEQASAIEPVEQAAPVQTPPAQDPVPAGTRTAVVEVPADGTSVVAQAVEQAAEHADAREPVAAEQSAAGSDQELPAVAAAPPTAVSVSGGEASGGEGPGGEVPGDVSADSGDGENEIAGEHDTRVSPHPTPSVSRRRWWRRLRVRQGH